MKLKLLVSICMMFSVIWLFHFTEFFFIKFYPVFANLTVFFIFFLSLFSKETVVQKFAKAVEGDLSERKLKYTRVITYIWSVFTFCNFILSFVSVYCDSKIWAIYNGLISYLLIGTLFFVEYIIRRILIKKKII